MRKKEEEKYTNMLHKRCSFLMKRKIYIYIFKTLNDKQAEYTNRQFPEEDLKDVKFSSSFQIKKLVRVL